MLTWRAIIGMFDVVAMMTVRSASRPPVRGSSSCTSSETTSAISLPARRPRQVCRIAAHGCRRGWLGHRVPPRAEDATPYQVSHSTQVAGYAASHGGDDRRIGNLFLGDPARAHGPASRVSTPITAPPGTTDIPQRDSNPA